MIPWLHHEWYWWCYSLRGIRRVMDPLIYRWYRRLGFWVFTTFGCLELIFVIAGEVLAGIAKVEAMSDTLSPRGVVIILAVFVVVMTLGYICRYSWRSSLFDFSSIVSFEMNSSKTCRSWHTLDKDLTIPLGLLLRLSRLIGWLVVPNTYYLNSSSTPLRPSSPQGDGEVLLLSCVSRSPFAQILLFSPILLLSISWIHIQNLPPDVL
jgi:hypothetical protein